MQICRFCGKLIPTEKTYDPGELWICKECEDKHKRERKAMFFEWLIDGVCRMILVCLAVGIAGFFASVAVILIGEKMKWW